MAIPQHTIDQILDRLDLVELIGSRIKLKKAGKTYTACCPFHQEKSPSFNVDRNKGFYHCFGCHAHGNAIGFLMEYENRNFIDVIKDLAQQAGIELPKNSQDDQNKFSYKRNEAARPPLQKITHNKTANTSDKSSLPAKTGNTSAQGSDPFDIPLETDASAGFAPVNHLMLDDLWQDHSNQGEADAGMSSSASKEGNLYDLLEQVAQFYQQQLTNNRAAQAYLNNRGLDDKACEFWRLGYAPSDWQHLEQHFSRDVEGLKTVGLIRDSEKGRAYDLLRDRVIFPIRDAKGRVVGFGGRALSDDIKPKYINSPESVIFHKSEILYGLYEGRKARASQWLMVEGYMDVIALQQAGLPGAVASLGTATNVEHLNTLFKQSNKITLAFDGDTAGQRAAWRTLELALPALSDGRELRFLVLPEQHDPDSLIRQEGLGGIRRRIEQAPPLSDFLFESLAQQIDIKSPEGKSRLMQEARALTALLPAKGSFKRLLDQSLRDRLGLGWNKKPAAQQQLLSFEQSSSLEEKALLLLLQYPALFSQMTSLIDLADANHAFGRALYLMQQAEEELPDDPEQCLYFLLGAWPNEQERNKLCHLLDAVDMGVYVQQPERLDGLCQEIVLQLKKLYLSRKMNVATSVQAQQDLKNQLLEVSKKLSFREDIA
ncbi:MAG: DNA primase [Moraxellaceae bacterium]|nr:MAG: DNA primase [Moraxellaceae bacterium]